MEVHLILFDIDGTLEAKEERSKCMPGCIVGTTSSSTYSKNFAPSAAVKKINSNETKIKLKFSCKARPL